MAELTDTSTIREAVRERYAAAAKNLNQPQESAGCCGSEVSCSDKSGNQVFGAELYDGESRDEVPEEAQLISLGCGNPTAVADLHEGRRCSTSVRAEASTFFCRRSGWARRARRTGST